MKNEPIVVFESPHCMACRMFKQKLSNAKLTFSSTEDPAATLKAAEESGLLSAPIVRIGATYYNAADAAKLLNI